MSNKEFFPGIGQVKYEGNETDNPLAFRWYDENKIIAGKSMKEHFALPALTGIHSATLVPILLVKARMYFHGMKKRMLLKVQKIKWMLHLNSSLK